MSINSSEYIAKSDNTRIEYPYNIINNFKDFRERLRLENEKKKNDSNLLKQLVPNHITKSEQDTFNKRQKEEKNKYVIPYIPEKEITLTSGRYNTGKISTNLLDSIYDAAKRTNTDVWTALAIAGNETGLGIARRNPDKSITNSDLVSNWQQFKTIYLTNNQIDKFYEIQDKIQNGTNTPEELELYKSYTDKLRKEYNSIRPITENPLDNIYNFYKTNNSNPGDPEYKTVKIPREAELLKADPAIQKWYSTKEPLEYKIGGRFTPKKSQLVKNAETQNTKRDMRKKFIKSDRATYTNNKVRKNQEGGILDNQISIDPNLFSSWNAVESNIEIPTNNTSIPETKLDRFIEVLNSRPNISSKLFDIDRINTEIQDNSEVVEDTKLETKKDKPKMDMTNPSKGTEAFNRIYDEVEKEYPEAAKYRAFLTTVAKYESGFNSKAKNKNAPAWGYFQFMQDDNKYNNIKTYAGVDTQTFLDNPKLQIIAAINLAKSMERGFSKEDMAAAESKGITKWGMLGGAWLGGNGGLRRYLLKDENISDKHWGGVGIDMINQIKRYNF